jgi:broad specificity phosphatase PhoE
MVRLLVVRHGQSTWNAERRWQGHADPPLSDLGRHQAKVAAEALGDVDRVVSSDLQRARETAEILADQACGGPVEVTAALRERAAGPWTGLTRDEIEARWPDALATGAYPDGYENDDVILARALPALTALNDPARDTVLVVTHGGLIGAVERHLGAQHRRTPNLGGRVLSLVDGGMVLGPELLLVDADEVTVTAPPET